MIHEVQYNATTRLAHVTITLPDHITASDSTLGNLIAYVYECFQPPKGTAVVATTATETQAPPQVPSKPTVSASTPIVTGVMPAAVVAPPVAAAQAPVVVNEAGDTLQAPRRRGRPPKASVQQLAAAITPAQIFAPQPDAEEEAEVHVEEQQVLDTPVRIAEPFSTFTVEITDAIAKSQSLNANIAAVYNQLIAANQPRDEKALIRHLMSLRDRGVAFMANFDESTISFRVIKALPVLQAQEQSA